MSSLFSKLSSLFAKMEAKPNAGKTIGQVIDKKVIPVISMSVTATEVKKEVIGYESRQDNVELIVSEYLKTVDKNNISKS